MERRRCRTFRTSSPRSRNCCDRPPHSRIYRRRTRAATHLYWTTAKVQWTTSEKQRCNNIRIWQSLVWASSTQRSVTPPVRSSWAGTQGMQHIKIPWKPLLVIFMAAKRGGDPPWKSTQVSTSSFLNSNRGWWQSPLTDENAHLYPCYADQNKKLEQAQRAPPQVLHWSIRWWDGLSLIYVTDNVQGYRLIKHIAALSAGPAEIADVLTHDLQYELRGYSGSRAQKSIRTVSDPSGRAPEVWDTISKQYPSDSAIIAVCFAISISHGNRS